MILKIIHTSDVHGSFVESDYDKYQNYGLLSLSSQIEKDENTILIDSGDIIQGNMFAHYIATEQPQLGKIYSQILNELKYDIFTFGNHEFNFGTQYLQYCIEDFEGQILNANIDGIDYTKPYTIIEKGNYKIGVIGLTTSSVPMFENSKNIEGLTFKDVLESYAKYEQELIAKCDYIIVNYHGGCEYDINDLETETETITDENVGVRLFNKFDSIDLLLTGHQHRQFIVNHDNRVISQPNRSALGFSYLEINLANKEVITSEFIENEGKEHQLGFLVENVNEQFNDYLNKVYGTCDKDLLITDHFQARTLGHELVNFLHKVQLHATNADISVTSLFDTAVGFEKNISKKQLLANFPFPNTLKVLRMHRDDILAAIEVSAEYFAIKNGELVESDKFTIPKRETYQYDLYYGFNYTLDINMPVGKRVIEHSLEDKYYDVCVNNYRASNFAWYPMYQNKELVNHIETNTVDLIINYLEENPQVKTESNTNFSIKY